MFPNIFMKIDKKNIHFMTLLRLIRRFQKENIKIRCGMTQSYHIGVHVQINYKNLFRVYTYIAVSFIV